jgi:hypothetical protein
MHKLLQTLGVSARLIILTTPTNSLWAVLLIWAIRIVTLALLIRTHIAPTVIRVLSTRLRVRSISLRSIRGLYLRTGRVIYTAERIKLGWRWVSQEKTVRVRITVESLSVELLSPTKKKTPRTSQKRHVRMPTLADLNPSPITPSFYTLTNYIVRPAITAVARMILRLVVLTLPTLTQILEVELDNTKVTSRPHSGATVTFRTANLSSHLAFIQPDSEALSNNGSSENNSPSPPSGKIASYWRFITSSSGERAWASTRGVAKLSLSISGISCFSGRKLPAAGSLDGMHRIALASFGSVLIAMIGIDQGAPLLKMPEGLKLDFGARFFPSTFTPDTGGLEASLDFGSVQLQLAEVLEVMKSMKSPESFTVDSVDSGDLLSPSETDVPKDVPLSPRRLRSMDPFSVRCLQTRLIGANVISGIP